MKTCITIRTFGS